jgi:hypothetical protein
MPLIPCPECGRQISTEAEACPQCGHPNRPAEPPAAPGPKCYACPAGVTTRCVRCGTLSCALHLNPVTVPNGYGAGRELHCQKCRDAAQAVTKAVAFLVLFGVLVLTLVVVISMSS